LVISEGDTIVVCVRPQSAVITLVEDFIESYHYLWIAQRALKPCDIESFYWMCNSSIIPKKLFSKSNLYLLIAVRSLNWKSLQPSMMSAIILLWTRGKRPSQASLNENSNWALRKRWMPKESGCSNEVDIRLSVSSVAQQTDIIPRKSLKLRKHRWKFHELHGWRYFV